MGGVNERVVITGMAASTCCGLGVDKLFKKFGKGVHPRLSRNVTGTNNKHSKEFTEIRHDISKLLRTTRTENRLTCHLLAAIDHDLGGHLSKLDEQQRSRTGLVIGNTSGNYTPYQCFYETATQNGCDSVNPVHFPATLLNYSTVQANNAFSLRGSSTTVSSGFSAGLDAIGYGAMRLRLGKEDRVLAGGVEEVNDHNLGFLKDEQALSSHGVIRPFGTQRGGTIPAEAVSVLLLEPLPAARNGNRRILGEILGYGTVKGNPRKGTECQLRRMVETTLQVLKAADLDRGEVEAIFPSANGTIKGDDLERKFLEDVFGSYLNSVPLYPIKTIVGECFTASGPLQTLAGIYGISQAGQTERKPPEKVEETKDVLLPDKITPCQKALVYSLGLDFSFSVLVLGKM